MYGKNFRVLNITQNAEQAQQLNDTVKNVTNNSISLVLTDHLNHARKILRSEDFDLVLLDLKLPGIPGLENFHQLRLEFPDIPVIVVTDETASPLALKAVSEGASDYLTPDEFQPGLLSRMFRYAVDCQHLVSKINDLSLVDELTGVNNRRSFELLFKQQVKGTTRHGGLMMLFNVTIENLTAISKNYGPPEADRAVLDTLDLIRETFRESDIIGRLEFDQFTILLPEAYTSSGEIMTERLLSGLNKLQRDNHRLYRLSLQIGNTLCQPNKFNNLGEILEIAKNASRKSSPAPQTVI